LAQSLDGYVDHQKMGPPAAALFRHFIDHMRDLTGMVYGRRTYEIMRYSDNDLPDWDAEERDCAAVWRSKPKWVVSRSLKSVGPNATLVENDFEAMVRGLKAQQVGEIDVAGPDLAGSLTNLGLIDEYRLYLRPIVLGGGKPLFVGPPAAAAPRDQRSRWRGCDSVDVRSCLGVPRLQCQDNRGQRALLRSVTL
jgi:dihydrofolate reductase